MVDFISGTDKNVSVALNDNNWVVRLFNDYGTHFICDIKEENIDKICALLYKARATAINRDVDDLIKKAKQAESDLEVAKLNVEIAKKQLEEATNKYKIVASPTSEGHG